jgi:hypothetical protein
VLNGVEEYGKRCWERTWRENEFGAASVETLFHQENPKSKCTSILSLLKAQQAVGYDVSISLLSKRKHERDKRVKTLQKFVSSLNISPKLQNGVQY